MASIEQMQQQLSVLTGGGPSIPGLGFEQVIDGLVESKFKDQLSAAPTQEDRKKLKDNLLNYYRTDGRLEVEQQINTIKSSAKNLAAFAITLPLAITGTAATIANLSTTTQAPAHIGALNALIENASTVGVSMLTAAIKINFSIPDAILAPLTIISSLQQKLNALKPS